jgi:hypothetical protein
MEVQAYRRQWVESKHWRHVECIYNVSSHCGIQRLRARMVKTYWRGGHMRQLLFSPQSRFKVPNLEKDRTQKASENHEKALHEFIVGHYDHVHHHALDMLNSWLSHSYTQYCYYYEIRTE